MVSKKLFRIPCYIALVIFFFFPTINSAQSQELTIPIGKRVSCRTDGTRFMLVKLRRGKLRVIKKPSKDDDRTTKRRYRRMRRKCKNEARFFRSASEGTLEGGNFTPGSSITEYFPEFPQPIHSGSARMKITFPSNYNPDDEFPVIVYLSGSYMIPTTLNWADGFIWVGLSGFKVNGSQANSPPDIDDANVTWPLHELMLLRLWELVPNSTRNPQRIAYGGFSNGAHMTAALLASPLMRERLLSYVNNIFLLDGGTTNYSAANSLLAANQTSLLRIYDGNVAGGGNFQRFMIQKHTHGHRNIGSTFFREYVNAFLEGDEPPVTTPPSVSNLNPAHNQNVYLGDNVVIRPTVSDRDGDIEKVEFYINNVKVSTDTTAPYRHTWTPTQTGNYKTKIIVHDQTGQTGTSVSNTIRVRTAAPEGVIYEAEDGALGGNLSLLDAASQVYLPVAHAPTGNDTLTITITAPEDGYYKFGVKTLSRYASYPIDFSVGGMETRWTIPKAGDWLERYITDSEGEPLSVFLEAGDHLVDITWIGPDSFASLDNITVEFDEATEPETDIFPLEVIDGDGSGDYEVDAEIPVSAESAPYPSMEFSKWVGDANDLIIFDEGLPETTLIMPNREAMIVATFQVRELFLLGDANGDEVIDGLDFLILKRFLGENVPRHTAADFNGDGLVDVQDYLIWQIGFNKQQQRAD